jgi:hypothetical protein
MEEKKIKEKPMREVCDKVELIVYLNEEVIRGEIPSSAMIDIYMKSGTLGVDSICLALLKQMGWNEIN